jgi:hypothetical protein
VPGSVPDATIATSPIPRGGVMRVEGTTCGGSISAYAHRGASTFSGSYEPSSEVGTPRSFALGVSVPASGDAGEYTVDISCLAGDAVFPPTIRTVSVSANRVDPVVTTITAPPSASPGEGVHLVGSGCHSGGLTGEQARVLVGTSGGFGIQWDEQVVAVEADGRYGIDASLPALRTPVFPKWFVQAYCVTADGMNYGQTTTTIALAAPPDTTVISLPHTN